MKKIFYTKQGRRYVPVSEYNSELTDSLPKGSHLIISVPGGVSRYFNIDPNYAALIAAGRVAEDAIRDAIITAQECRPIKHPITERQQKLWRELADSFKEQEYPIMRPSAVDAARAAVDAMVIEAEKLMKHPDVKKAYEQFLLVAELCK